MDVVFMKEFPVLPSVCDAAGALSYPGAFECFMDIATQHADRLGVGLHDLQPRNLFWLTVKTKVVFLCRPRMGENTTLITWPEVPGRLRCMRSYEMRQGDKLLLCAKTEWAVVDTATQRMVPASEVFPNGDLFRRDTACTEAFTMIPDHFDGIVGIYNLVQDSYTLLRTVFCLRLDNFPELKNNDPDGDIVAHHWLTLEECQKIESSMRSELVFDAIRDYLAGHIYPVNLITVYNKLSDSVLNTANKNIRNDDSM